MNVLVIGATGLIGSHVSEALLQAGCHVVGIGRRKSPDLAIEWKELDLAEFVEPQAWQPHLRDIDAVINCVGIIRETRAGDFLRLHQQMPVALFSACEQADISCVVQISALGSEPHAETEYWRTKGVADADLLSRNLSATVVQPSLVYGDKGASSRIFTMLATLPLTAMPMAHQALVQPIHVDDLAIVLKKILLGEVAAPKRLSAVGPRVLSMGGYINALRRGMGALSGVVIAIPAGLSRAIARCAELLPSSALTRDAFKMLEKSADGSNTADAAPVRDILGKALRDPENFPGIGQKERAVFSWALPVCRACIALLWLLTAYTSWFIWPHEESRQWLVQCGVPLEWSDSVLLAASLVDAGIGMTLLMSRVIWIWPLQISLVLGYTLIMSLHLPEFWMHPFGPLSKNLSILVLMFMMWRLSPQKERK